MAHVIVSNPHSRFATYVNRYIEQHSALSSVQNETFALI